MKSPEFCDNQQHETALRKDIKWAKSLKSVGLIGLQLLEKNHLEMSLIFRISDDKKQFI